MSHMPNEILWLAFAFAFVMGVAVGAIGALLLAAKAPRAVFTCPHGHSDWDECPVCGH